MKRRGHWFSLLCLAISLVWSPAAPVVLACVAPHPKSPARLHAEAATPGLVLVEESAGKHSPLADAPAPALCAPALRLGEPPAPVSLRATRVARKEAGAVTPERPSICGPPARAWVRL